MLALLSCAGDAARYKPLRKHPALFDAKAGWSRWIEPRLLDAPAELKAGNESAV